MFQDAGLVGNEIAGENDQVGRKGGHPAKGPQQVRIVDLRAYVQVAELNQSEADKSGREIPDRQPPRDNLEPVWLDKKGVRNNTGTGGRAEAA